MGWCSGTTVFDKIVAKTLDSKLSEEDQETIVEVLIDALEDNDWDCQSDSDYWDHPLVRKVFRQRNPEWFEE